MILPTTRRTHARVRELAAESSPPPRAFFVDELEGRLAELMRSSVTGDVLPQIELTPPAPAREDARARLALSAAALSMLLVVALAATLARIDHAHQRELRMASANAVVDGDGEPAATGAAAGGAASAPAGAADAPPAVAPALVSPHEDAKLPPALPPPAAASTPAHVAPIEASASGTPARVALTWGRYDGADFAAYLVLRSDGPAFDRPDGRGDGHLLLRIENREVLEHQDTPRVGTTPRYRVVVVDAAGTVVARSPTVMPWRPIDDQPAARVTLPIG